MLHESHCSSLAYGLWSVVTTCTLKRIWTCIHGMNCDALMSCSCDKDFSAKLEQELVSCSKYYIWCLLRTVYSVELEIKSVFCDFDGRKKRELLSLRLLLFFVCFSSLKKIFCQARVDSPVMNDEHFVQAPQHSHRVWHYLFTGQQHRACSGLDL